MNGFDIIYLVGISPPFLFLPCIDLSLSLSRFSLRRLCFSLSFLCVWFATIFLCSFDIIVSSFVVTILEQSYKHKPQNTQHTTCGGYCPIFV